MNGNWRIVSRDDMIFIRAIVNDKWQVATHVILLLVYVIVSITFVYCIVASLACHRLHRLSSCWWQTKLYTALRRYLVGFLLVVPVLLVGRDVD